MKIIRERERVIERENGGKMLMIFNSCLLLWHTCETASLLRQWIKKNKFASILTYIVKAAVTILCECDNDTTSVWVQSDASVINWNAPINFQERFILFNHRRRSQHMFHTMWIAESMDGEGDREVSYDARRAIRYRKIRSELCVRDMDDYFGW